LKEGDLMRLIQMEATKCGARVFRNNIGTLRDQYGRFVTFGVCNPGGSDLIGWTTVNGIAVFTAIEVKTDSGKLTPEQVNFIDVVRQSGGIAGVARSTAEVQTILRGML
jgi:hypothetical protein